MRTYKEIENFIEWSVEDKDQFAVNVIKGLVMDGDECKFGSHGWCNVLC